MSFFRKRTPNVCPKCGKADGWRCAPDEPSQSYFSQAKAVNPFSPAPIRGSFAMNMSGMKGKGKKVRYHCDNCGFEKSF